MKITMCIASFCWCCFYALFVMTVMTPWHSSFKTARWHNNYVGRPAWAATSTLSLGDANAGAATAVSIRAGIGLRGLQPPSVAVPCVGQNNIFRAIANFFSGGGRRQN